MNDKDILLDMGGEQDEVVRVSRRKLWSGILAAVICLLLAGLVWVCVMNSTDTDYIPIRVVSPEGYTCTLSVDGVEVEGSVAALRRTKEIVITISEYDAEYVLYYGGELSVNESILDLPEDMRLAGVWNAKMSVKKN